jgi:hypothetical protein
MARHRHLSRWKEGGSLWASAAAQPAPLPACKATTAPTASARSCMPDDPHRLPELRLSRPGGGGATGQLPGRVLCNPHLRAGHERERSIRLHVAGAPAALLGPGAHVHVLRMRAGRGQPVVPGRTEGGMRRPPPAALNCRAGGRGTLPPEPALRPGTRCGATHSPHALETKAQTVPVDLRLGPAGWGVGRGRWGGGGGGAAACRSHGQRSLLAKAPLPASTRAAPQPEPQGAGPGNGRHVPLTWPSARWPRSGAWHREPCRGRGGGAWDAVRHPQLLPPITPLWHTHLQLAGPRCLKSRACILAGG